VQFLGTTQQNRPTPPERRESTTSSNNRIRRSAGKQSNTVVVVSSTTATSRKKAAPSPSRHRTDSTQSGNGDDLEVIDLAASSDEESQDRTVHTAKGARNRGRNDDAGPARVSNAATAAPKAYEERRTKIRLLPKDQNASQQSTLVSIEATPSVALKTSSQSSGSQITSRKDASSQSGGAVQSTLKRAPQPTSSDPKRRLSTSHQNSTEMTHRTPKTTEAAFLKPAPGSDAATPKQASFASPGSTKRTPMAGESARPKRKETEQSPRQNEPKLTEKQRLFLNAISGPRKSVRPRHSTSRIPALSADITPKDEYPMVPQKYVLMINASSKAVEDKDRDRERCLDDSTTNCGEEDASVGTYATVARSYWRLFCKQCNTFDCPFHRKTMKDLAIEAAVALEYDQTRAQPKSTGKRCVDVDPFDELPLPEAEPLLDEEVEEVEGNVDMKVILARMKLICGGDLQTLNAVTRGRYSKSLIVLEDEQKEGRFETPMANSVDLTNAVKQKPTAKERFPNMS
jgi:hypothetical protein